MDTTAASFKPGQRGKMFVMLKWSEYHQLSINASGIYSEEIEKLKPESDSYLDKIYRVEGEEEANDLISAFEKLAQADWTPNQTTEDKEYYSKLRHEAQSILKRYADIESIQW